MYVGKESMNMIISFNKEEEHVTCRLHSTGKEMEHCQLGVVMGDEGLFFTLLHIPQYFDIHCTSDTYTMNNRRIGGRT